MQDVRKGSQTPRLKYRNGEVAGSEIDDLCLVSDSLGVQFMPWQKTVVSDWCAYTSLNTPSYITCGLDVPRQNGKNAGLEMYEWYRMAICGWKILHTAHRVKTVKKAFRRLLKFFEDNKNIESAVPIERVSRTNGEEGIFLTNGASIEYVSRTNGTARGFDDIQLVVYDEAQELTDAQFDAIAYTLAASSTGERQIIYMGTPPNEQCAGTVFARTRKAALNGEMRSVSWLSWATPKLPKKNATFADVLDDVYLSNPSMGYVLSEEFTESEFASSHEGNLTGFAHERLGWWSEVTGALAFAKGKWDELVVDEAPKDGKVAYGVKFSPDGAVVALAACRRPKTGMPFVELVAYKSMADGFGWLSEWLYERRDKCALLALDGKSNVAELKARLEELGFPKKAMKVCGTQDVTDAATRFFAAVNEKEITHSDERILRESVVNAQKRPIGRAGGFGWEEATGDYSAPIDAAMLAYWAVMTTKRKPGRKARIL